MSRRKSRVSNERLGGEERRHVVGAIAGAEEQARSRTGVVDRGNDKRWSAAAPAARGRAEGRGHRHDRARARSTRARTSTRRTSPSWRNSIRQKGLVQPIIVRPAETGGYEIVAGERRWRAAQRAGLHTDSGHRPRAQRPGSARARHHRERPARRPQCHRGSRGLPRSHGAVQLYAGALWPRSSARAVATWPIRCAC